MMKISDLKGQIEDYLRYSQIERGLSENTITAYRQDLYEFLDFIKKRRYDFLANKSS